MVCVLFCGHIVVSLYILLITIIIMIINELNTIMQKGVDNKGAKRY